MIVLHADPEARPNEWTWANLAKVASGSLAYAEGMLTESHIMGPSAGITLLPPEEGSYDYSDNPFRYTRDPAKLAGALANLTYDGDLLEPLRILGRGEPSPVFIGNPKDLGQVFKTATGTKVTLARKFLRLTGFYSTEFSSGIKTEIRMGVKDDITKAVVITRTAPRRDQDPWKWSCVLSPIHLDLDRLFRKDAP